MMQVKIDINKLKIPDTGNHDEGWESSTEKMDRNNNTNKWTDT